MERAGGDGPCPGVAGIPVGNPRGERGKAGTKGAFGCLESLSPHCQEKPLSVDALVPVPQTDTGR